MPIAGPIILFIVGLIAWLIDWPDATLDMVLMWLGVAAMVGALVWAALIFSGRARYRA